MGQAPCTDHCHDPHPCVPLLTSRVFSLIAALLLVGLCAAMVASFPYSTITVLQPLDRVRDSAAQRYAVYHPHRAPPRSASVHC